MRDHGTDEPVYLPDPARRGVELAADRPREARPGSKDGLACGGPVQREGVAGGFRAGDPWERVVDVGARQ
jgi:catechol-2,3-dioxygenase